MVPPFPWQQNNKQKHLPFSFNAYGYISLGGSKVLWAWNTATRCISLSLLMLAVGSEGERWGRAQYVELVWELGLLLICKKKDKKWAIFCTLPVLRLSACESVNHMGISNFFLLGIAVIHRDVERTLKSQSLKGKSVKNENGLSRRREREGER